MSIVQVEKQKSAYRVHKVTGKKKRVQKHSEAQNANGKRSEGHVDTMQHLGKRRWGKEQSKAGGADGSVNNGWSLQWGHNGCVVTQSQRQSEIPRQGGDNAVQTPNWLRFVHELEA